MCFLSIYLLGFIHRTQYNIHMFINHRQCANFLFWHKHMDRSDCRKNFMWKGRCSSCYRNYTRHIPCPWWRHQMETFSALLALCAGNSPVPVNSPHKGQWRGALMFSFIYAWINDWINNREAGDLRRQRGHYDGIVMRTWLPAMVHLHCFFTT